MREISPNVWQLIGFPPNFVNVYLIGDVLIDAATRWAGRRILRQIGDRKLSMLALTHAHPDHQGVAKMICERYRIPLACHAADVPTMQGERPMQPDNSVIRLISLFWAWTLVPRGSSSTRRGRDSWFSSSPHTGTHAGANYSVP